MAKPVDYEGPPQPFTPELQQRFRNYARIVAQYPVNLELGGEAGDTDTDVAQFRPEPFVCRRITWATTADTLLHTGTLDTWLPWRRSMAPSAKRMRKRCRPR